MHFNGYLKKFFHILVFLFALVHAVVRRCSTLSCRARHVCSTATSRSASSCCRSRSRCSSSRRHRNATPRTRSRPTTRCTCSRDSVVPLGSRYSSSFSTKCGEYYLLIHNRAWIDFWDAILYIVYNSTYGTTYLWRINTCFKRAICNFLVFFDSSSINSIRLNMRRWSSSSCALCSTRLRTLNISAERTTTRSPILPPSSHANAVLFWQLIFDCSVEFTFHTCFTLLSLIRI